MDEELLERWFKMPDDPPSRRPRFGPAGPPEPFSLAGVQFDDRADPRPFERDFDMKDLGFTLRLVRKHGTRPAELWALAENGDPSLLGKEVRVGLIGQDETIRRVVVKFTDREETGCYGEARVGTVDEIREQLGDRIDAGAFLLD